MFQCAAARLTTKGGSTGFDSVPRGRERFLKSNTAVSATRVSLCLCNKTQPAIPATTKMLAAIASSVRFLRSSWDFGIRKVAIAGAARTEMIEPLFSLVEWHRSRCDSLQNVRAWTSAAFGIWKVLEQTTAKCVQESLFVSRGISSCVQTSLLLQRHNIKSKRCQRILSNHRSQIFSFQQPDNTLP